MNQSNKSSKLNLQKYLTFYQAFCENAFALGIYSKLGKQYLLSTTDHSENLQLFLQQSETLDIDWDRISEQNNFLSIENVGYIQFVKLILGANDEEFWLLGCQRTNQVLNTHEQAASLNFLSHIASCLNEDYLLAKTVAGMADELAVRYEELNLLYGIDEVETFYKDNDEHESLSQLIKNCVDYLNIDLGALLLPDQDIFIHHLGVDTESINWEQVKQGLISDLFGYLTTNQETLVINHDSQIDWTDLDWSMPYKLIAAPIFKVNHSLCGILVLINNLNKQDFSNSDRKLTEVMASEASKLIQARHDPTTGQLNRRGFTERLDKIIQQQKTSNNVSCLLFIDLDQFKLINESSGLSGGDHLLKQVSTLLQKNMKSTDVLGRLGSDEFVIVLNNCNLQNAQTTADRIRIFISQFRFVYKEKIFEISTCIGVVELNKSIENFSQALSAADLACTIAKEEGGNRVHVHQLTDEAMLKHEKQMQWVGRINGAIDENRFQIYRQKIQLLQKDPEQEDHYELLLRLKDENDEILTPYHFIPTAERYNMMPKIDRWVIKNALTLMALEFEHKPETKLICSINLSGQSFCEEGFVTYVLEQIKHSGVPANRICFEMTETAAVSNLTQAVEFMETLKKIGCQFSLDDFGSGMSSFTYLKNLPVDYLKIDGYFVKTMLENKIDHAMVASIHQIGSVMGLKTIAEFVENDEIFKELKNMGVDYGQGYGIGKPEPFVINY
ncbi:MAG: EAL domain-containing protein [Methylococcaceae bacterium]|nr:EAL domain-containing protein [Methylococcaceae bacterium]